MIFKLGKVCQNKNVTSFVMIYQDGKKFVERFLLYKTFFLTSSDSLYSSNWRWRSEQGSFYPRLDPQILNCFFLDFRIETHSYFLST